MKNQTSTMDIAKNNYLVIVIGALGVLAFLVAFVIAWPALAHVCSNLFG